MPETDERLLTKYQDAVIREFKRATSMYGPFASDHEAYAVLLEEMDELWDAVKLKQTYEYRRVMIEKECIQVAAMALRFLHDTRRNYERNGNGQVLNMPKGHLQGDAE
jgi:hypothetical protein